MTDAQRLMQEKSRDVMLQKLANTFVKSLIENGWFQTCCNCEHWNEQKEICTKFNQRPPAKVIVVGCEHHSDNIPF